MGAGPLIPLELAEAQQGAAAERRPVERKWKSGSESYFIRGRPKGVKRSSDMAR